MLPTEDEYVEQTGPLIFEDMLRNSGGERNFGLDGKNALGRMWATAHGLASVKWHAEKAFEQLTPRTADVLLGQLEWELGSIPRPGATLLERQEQVAALAILPLGARLSNVQNVLTETLGDDFVAFVTTSKADMAVSNDEAQTEVSVPAKRFTASWDHPNSPPGLFRLASHVNSKLAGVLDDPSGQTAWLMPIGGNTQLSFFQRVIFDLGHYTRTEALRVSIIETPNPDYPSTHPLGQYRIECNPRFPHDKGSYVLSGRVPSISSTKRHSYVVLTAEAAASGPTRATVHSLLRRLMRGVSTWSIVAENSPGSGTAGPFVIGTSIIGTTPIKEITF